MQVGINYPWTNCGWDFGNPPQTPNTWGTRAAWKAKIGADLAEFQSIGVFAVRWFILYDGTNYGTGSAAPHRDQHPSRRGQWRFDDPPSLAPEIVQDFRDLLRLFAGTPIKLLPSLISFEWCKPGSPHGNGHHVGGGRSDVLNDPSKRTRFCERVLEPLLQASRAHANAIYAWEVMNEPDWVTAGLGLGEPANRTVSMANMEAFLRETVRRINNRGFRSTVGFARYETMQRYSQGVGATIHQFHYYGGHALRRHVFHPNWPCIVGEFNTTAAPAWSAAGSGCSGASVVDMAAKLRLLRDLGYPAAFAWSRYDDDRTDYKAFRRGLQTFRSAP